MDTFAKEGLVPDVIDDIPQTCLKVSHGDLDLTPGQVRTPTQVKNEPTVTWNAEEDAFYTLIFNDPDAPSRLDNKFGEFHHWLVVNIPGNNLGDGEVMSQYIGSGPGEGSGLHRYIFLLYKQKGRQDFQGLSKLDIVGSLPQRRNWKAREFARKYDLGKPVAGNFYLAEYDDYVPVLRQQLGLLQATAKA